MILLTSLTINAIISVIFGPFLLTDFSPSYGSHFPVFLVCLLMSYYMLGIPNITWLSIWTFQKYNVGHFSWMIIK